MGHYELEGIINCLRFFPFACVFAFIGHCEGSIKMCGGQHKTHPRGEHDATRVSGGNNGHIQGRGG